MSLSPRSWRTRLALGGLAIAASALVAAGCGGDEDSAATATGATAAAFPMTIESCGRSVTLAEPPQRVLTIGTAAVNMLHAAGAADRIVARAGEFDAPIRGDAGRQVADVEIITPADPNAEAIIATGADLVIGYGLIETNEGELERAGIAALELPSSCAESGGVDLDDIYADVERVGEIFSTAEVAEGNVAALRERERSALEGVVDGPTRSAASVYFFGGAPSASGARNVIHSVMGSLGLENSFGEVDRDFLEPSVEELIDRDPEVIILSGGTGAPGETVDDLKGDLLALPGAANLTAVREGRLVIVPADGRDPSPTAVDGLETLAEQLRELG